MEKDTNIEADLTPQRGGDLERNDMKQDPENLFAIMVFLVFIFGCVGFTGVIFFKQKTPKEKPIYVSTFEYPKDSVNSYFCDKYIINDWGREECIKEVSTQEGIKRMALDLKREIWKNKECHDDDLENINWDEITETINNL